MDFIFFSLSFIVLAHRIHSSHLVQNIDGVNQAIKMPAIVHVLVMLSSNGLWRVFWPLEATLIRIPAHRHHILIVIILNTAHELIKVFTAAKVHEFLHETLPRLLKELLCTKHTLTLQKQTYGDWSRHQFFVRQFLRSFKILNLFLKPCCHSKIFH